MREIFEKYYTAHLSFQPDPHFQPTIKEVEGEFDTEKEARAAAEAICDAYYWEILIFPHFKKIK